MSRPGDIPLHRLRRFIATESGYLVCFTSCPARLDVMLSRSRMMCIPWYALPASNKSGCYARRKGPSRSLFTACWASDKLGETAAFMNRADSMIMPQLCLAALEA